MLKKVQMRGGARRPHARRSRVGGVRGHVWAPQTDVRRPDCLARYVARWSRAPYLRRWALLISLAWIIHDVAVTTARSAPRGRRRERMEPDSSTWRPIVRRSTS